MAAGPEIARTRFGRRPFLGMVGLAVSARPAGGVAAYIGNFTKAIGLARLGDTGTLTATGTVNGLDNPAFLTLAARGTTLYAVNDTDSGRVTALAVGAGGGLTVLGGQPTGGAMPTHLTIHPSGRFLLVANYGAGSTAVFPINSDGTLGARTDLVQYTGSGPDPTRQDGPHAHMVAFDPAGRYLYVPDLGTDQVHVHALDLGTGRLRSIGDTALPSGAGPRHLAFHPTTPAVYVADELDSTVAVCAQDPTSGLLTPGQVLPAAPPGGARNYPAEILVSQDGRFVYVSNRGHNSVAVFAIEADGRRLRAVGTTPCGGNWPRHITIDRSGRFLFASNQYSNSVTAFSVDQATGRLSPIGRPLSTPSPVCLLLGQPVP
ncbi:lactonase family protein [Kutzneria albida]|uniref:6-phosphogluconolactonase n=1 Tax=Kutzneria albida DSM 43870 TaxID=1449976 RepID=W5WDR4_9PSEU|nr:lactonase family protein [Kutzneria albida]AHH98910.1 hypothetical protein KALB_5548 [Kutzneria albida DSM 43870]